MQQKIFNYGLAFIWVLSFSSFSFKGKEVDIMEIGNKLEVDNVLEGSVRKSGDKLRLTAQLIKVSDGFHLWSERYDRQMANVFEIRDEISKSILEALKITLLGGKEASFIFHQTKIQGITWFKKRSQDG